MGFLATDTFQDAADATDLVQHSMNVGQGWQSDPVAGAFQIFSGHAVAQGTTPAPALAWTETNTADVVIEGELSLAGTNGVMGLIVRLDDKDNYWRATIGEAGLFELWKVIGGVARRVTYTQPSPPIDVNARYRVQVACSGPRITATLDGGNTLNNGSDATLSSSTRHGLVAGLDNAPPQGETFYSFSAKKPPVIFDADVVVNGDLTVNGALTVAGNLSCAQVVGDLNLNSRLTFRDGAGAVIASLSPIPNTDAAGNPAPGYMLQYVVATGPSGPAVEITTDGHAARELLSLAAQDGTTTYLACHKATYQVVCHIGANGRLA